MEHFSASNETTVNRTFELLKTLEDVSPFSDAEVLICASQMVEHRRLCGACLTSSTYSGRALFAVHLVDAQDNV